MKNNAHLAGGIATVFFGVLTVSLYANWFNKYFGGLGAQGAHLFNWHMLCATLSLFIFMLPASGFFRALSGMNTLSFSGKRTVHALLNLFALGFMIAAIVVVYRFHDQIHVSHFYTVHSWIGLTFVILMGLQWIFGAIVLLLGIQVFPTRTLIEMHRALGGLFLGLTAAVVASGTVEKQTFNGAEKLQSVNVHANSMVLIALLTIAVAAGVLYYRPEGRMSMTEEVPPPPFKETDPLIRA